MRTAICWFCIIFWVILYYFSRSFELMCAIGDDCAYFLIGGSARIFGKYGWLLIMSWMVVDYRWLRILSLVLMVKKDDFGWLRVTIGGNSEWLYIISWVIVGDCGWLWVIVGDYMWVIVYHFLGDCGWLWVIVGDFLIVGDCASFPGWLWVIVGDGCASFPGWLWVIVHQFLGDCVWLWVIVGDCGW